MLEFLLSFFVAQPVFDVYFCPFDNCTAVFGNVIHGAKTADCAFYELGEEVSHAFDSVDSYRLVIDGDEKEEYQPNARYENKSSLMHNKFCVINESLVLMGSTNPTKSGLEVNHNEIVIVRSKKIANAYVAEFEELWDGVYSKGSRNKISYSARNCSVRPYFCPEDTCEEAVIEQLRLAKKKIVVSAFVLSSKEIMNQLILAAHRNVSVTVFLDKRQAFRALTYLQNQPVSVFVPDIQGMFHYKLFLIDDVVITGSFNPTSNGNTQNDENMLIVDCGLRQKYDWLTTFYVNLSKKQTT